MAGTGVAEQTPTGVAATDVLTGRRCDREVPLVELLDTYPVALLVR